MIVSIIDIALYTPFLVLCSAVMNDSCKTQVYMDHIMHKNLALALYNIILSVFIFVVRNAPVNVMPHYPLYGTSGVMWGIWQIN